MQIRLIIPTHDKATVRDYAERIAKVCGGCTVTQGQGYWHSAVALCIDDVTVIDADVMPTQWTEGLLRRIAADVCTALRQECVYLKLGELLYFVDTQGKNADEE